MADELALCVGVPDTQRRLLLRVPVLSPEELDVSRGQLESVLTIS